MSTEKFNFWDYLTPCGGSRRSEPSIVVPVNEHGGCEAFGQPVWESSWPESKFENREMYPDEEDLI